MTTIHVTFKPTTRDGISYTEVNVDFHVNVKKKDLTAPIPQSGDVAWEIKNSTSAPLNNVAVLDFFGTKNRGTAFPSGNPAPVNVPARGAGGPGTGTINAVADGTVDIYKYTVIANGTQVIDPELEIEP
jgi:hypothetical protein